MAGTDEMANEPRKPEDEMTRLAKAALYAFGASATFGLAAIISIAANWVNPDVLPMAAASSIVVGACGGLLKIAWDFYRSRRE